MTDIGHLLTQEPAVAAIQDARAAFYLDNRALIETWAELRTEASAAIHDRLRELVSVLAADVQALDRPDLQIDTTEGDDSPQRVTMTSSYWSTAGRPCPAMVVIEWKRNVLQAGGQPWLWVGWRPRPAHPDARHNTEFLAQLARELRTDLHGDWQVRGPEFPLWTWIRPAGDGLDPEQLVREARAQFWRLWAASDSPFTRWRVSPQPGATSFPDDDPWAGPPLFAEDDTTSRQARTEGAAPSAPNGPAHASDDTGADRPAEVLRTPPVLATYRNLADDVWKRTDTGWEAIDPPEDLALPPILAWTDDQRALVERQYNETWAKYLSPGQRYQISWPPTGHLTNAGSWYRSDGEACSEHDVDYDDDCEECTSIEHGEELVERPAAWSWTVQVDAYEDTGDGNCDLVESDHEVLVTEMDPRDVEYGPPKSTTPRRELDAQAERLWRTMTSRPATTGPHGATRSAGQGPREGNRDG